VFNHLYAFFSRYYESGDFIPKRFYGSNRERYAVPYNGEETFFHWANRDQHYVKTGETFKDYAFTVDVLGLSYRVRFVLAEASIPPGNTKGDARFFFPQPCSYDKSKRELRLPFHYRLPSQSELEKNGKNTKGQDAILQGALPHILKAVTDSGLKARLAEIVDKKRPRK
jgi:adenine-specific DNA-methyltransferase